MGENFPDLTRWKGGEKVSIESIKRVTEAEQTAQTQKSEAILRARKMVGDAEKAGQAALNEAKAGAQAEVSALMAEAETAAAAKEKEIMSASQEACDALRTAAAQKLQEAAALIVERVVAV